MSQLIFRTGPLADGPFALNLHIVAIVPEQGATWHITRESMPGHCRVESSDVDMLPSGRIQYRSLSVAECKSFIETAERERKAEQARERARKAARRALWNAFRYGR